VRYPLLTSSESLNNLYLCTLCGYCKETCPNEVDLPSVVEHARAELTQNLEPLRAHKIVAERIQRYGNPYEQSRDDRNAWLKKLDFTPYGKDTVFFAGCTSASEVQGIPASTAKILNHAGVKFKVLNDEPCCGGPLLKTGFTTEARQQAKKTLTLLKDVKEVVTSCPLCFRTFTIDYPTLVGTLPFKVIHSTQYISDLIQKGKVKLNEVHKKVTYHDPCELGRYCGVYEAPRDILKAIPGLELFEPHSSRNTNICCGAGGGVKTAFPKLAMDIAADKLDGIIAEKTGVEAIVTACPACIINFRDGAKKATRQLEIHEISEIVCQSMRI
jgi:heterodisulfide reductase subunit D